MCSPNIDRWHRRANLVAATMWYRRIDRGLRR